MHRPRCQRRAIRTRLAALALLPFAVHPAGAVASRVGVASLAGIFVPSRHGSRPNVADDSVPLADYLDANTRRPRSKRNVDAPRLLVEPDGPDLRITTTPPAAARLADCGPYPARKRLPLLPRHPFTLPQRVQRTKPPDCISGVGKPHFRHSDFSTGGAFALRSRRRARLRSPRCWRWRAEGFTTRIPQAQDWSRRVWADAASEPHRVGLLAARHRG